MYPLLLFCLLDLCSGHIQTILYNAHSELRIVTQQNAKKLSSHVLVKDIQASSFAYFYNASLICWGEEDTSEIQCASFNGTNSWNRTVYAKNVANCECMAADWLTKKLYWTDKLEHRIEVLSLETKYRKVLYWDDVDQPRGIAVDPSEGLLFWADWGNTPAIERASMNGDLSTRKQIVHRDLIWPNSISLDLASKKLYWLDGKSYTIEVANYDGSEREVLVHEALMYEAAYPVFMSMSDSKFYWSDWAKHCIYSIDRVERKSVDVIVQSNSRSPFFDIHSYDVKQQPYAPTPCDQNNGGCSHLCLLSASVERYSCDCPIGIRLEDDRTCAKEVQNVLFLLQRTEISQVSLDTPDHTSITLPLTVENAVAVDIDPIERYIYWTDEITQSIYRATFDGRGLQKVVKDGILVPDGLALDWIAKNLYWCDSAANRIEVVRLNTPHRKVVVFEDIDKPRAVVVYPQQGWLFWSEWSDTKPKIERSELDGTNRLVLVKSDIVWPNCLALDFESKKLYFGDAGTDVIEVINLDGRDRHEVVVGDLLHIFGLTILGDYLYWTDWSRRTLESANKHSPRTNRTVLLETVTDVMGLKASTRYGPNGTTPCAVNNGGCAHFCLSKPGNKYVCACEIEFELQADRRACARPASYFMVLSHNRVRRMSMETGSTDTLPISDVKSISAIDVSPAERRVYWADSRMKTISSGYLNGSLVETFVSCGLQAPESLALDWLASNIYWADASLRRIEVVSISGVHRRTLFWGDLNEPRNLVVNPRVGFMFWSEWNQEFGTIMKASMDGSLKRVIVDNVGRVNGLTIDYTHRNLYWTYSKLEKGYIERCDAAGQNRQVILDRDDSVPYSIAQSDDRLFWTQNSSIVQLHISTGTRTTLHALPTGTSNLTVVDSAKQGGWNSCVINNTCRYLCLVRPGFEPLFTETVCACPTHYTMSGDYCRPPENYLLYSQRNTLYRLITRTSECPDFPLLYPGLKGVRAIEYDSIENHVYWIENKTKIRHGIEDDPDPGVLVELDPLSQVWDMVIEPFSRLLFWTSMTTNSINVTRLDNSSVGCIYEGGNDENVRDLAIHPEKGLLFWTVTGARARIVQARLHGGDQVNIETDGKVADALAVDRRSCVLYLAFGGQLYAYNIADRIRRDLYLKVNGKVISMAVMRSWLYWVNREADTQRIERVNVNVNTVSDRMMIVRHTNVTHMSHIIDLIAVDPKDDSYPDHPCSSANAHGGCSHLCMPSIKNLERAECACPLTMELGKDSRSCFVPSPVTTPEPSPEPEPEQEREREREVIGCRSENGRSVCDGDNVDCTEGSDHCGESKSIPMKDRYTEGGSSVQFFVACVALVMLAVLGVCYYSRLKANRLADCKHEVAMKSLAMTVAPHLPPRSSSQSPHSSNNATSSVVSFPMAHLTERSSSSSMMHYPLNPPPSPTTTTMQQDECSCSDYTAAMPIHLPTPCSTDVCDSDASYPMVNMVYVGDRRNRSRRQTRYQQQRLQSSIYEEMPPRLSEIGAPPPPPPTPNNMMRCSSNSVH